MSRVTIRDVYADTHLLCQPCKRVGICGWNLYAFTFHICMKSLLNIQIRLLRNVTFILESYLVKTNLNELVNLTKIHNYMLCTRKCFVLRLLIEHFYEYFKFLVLPKWRIITFVLYIIKHSNKIVRGKRNMFDFYRRRKCQL